MVSEVYTKMWRSHESHFSSQFSIKTDGWSQSAKSTLTTHQIPTCTERLSTTITKTKWFLKHLWRTKKKQENLIKKAFMIARGNGCQIK